MILYDTGIEKKKAQEMVDELQGIYGDISNRVKVSLHGTSSSALQCKIYIFKIFFRSIKENLNIKVAIRKKLEELHLDKDVKIYDLESYNKMMNEIWKDVTNNKKGGK